MDLWLEFRLSIVAFKQQQQQQAIIPHPSYWHATGHSVHGPIHVYRVCIYSILTGKLIYDQGQTISGCVWGTYKYADRSPHWPRMMLMRNDKICRLLFDKSISSSLVKSSMAVSWLNMNDLWASCLFLKSYSIKVPSIFWYVKIFMTALET